MNTGQLDEAISRLQADRERGGTALARDAVEILAAAPVAERQIIADRLAALRPSMPAIAAIVREACALTQPLQLLEELEAEHERVARVTADLIAGGSRVGTISNSSLVGRVLLRARPKLAMVAVQGIDDEGHALVARLTAAGLDALAVASPAIDVDLAVVGCDVIFSDGGFVNRRGTGALLARIQPRQAIVVGDRWRRVSGETPPYWLEADLFEPVQPMTNVRIVS